MVPDKTPDPIQDLEEYRLHSLWRQIAVYYVTRVIVNTKRKLRK